MQNDTRVLTWATELHDAYVRACGVHETFGVLNPAARDIWMQVALATKRPAVPSPPAVHFQVGRSISRAFIALNQTKPDVRAAIQHLQEATELL